MAKSEETHTDDVTADEMAKELAEAMNTVADDLRTLAGKVTEADTETTVGILSVAAHVYGAMAMAEQSAYVFGLAGRAFIMAAQAHGRQGTNR